MTESHISKPRPIRVRAYLSTVLIIAALATAGCGSSSKSASTSSAASASSKPATTATTTPTTSSTKPKSTTSKTTSTPTTGTGATVKPSTSTLIAQADAICKQLNGELGSGSSAQAGSTQEVREILHNAVLEHGTLVQLGKLVAPASLAGEWKKILGFRQTLADELLTIAGYVRNKDQKKLEASSVAKYRVHQELAEVAGHAGFKDCSHVGPAIPSASPSSAASGKTHTAALHSGR